MGSQSFSAQEDMRTAVEGDVDVMVSPGSQLVNPLGIALSSDMASATNATITYRDVTVNEYPADLNELIASMTEYSQNTIDAILASSQDTVETVSNTTDTLSDVIEGTETPLSQYIPYAVLGLILVLVLKWRK